MNIRRITALLLCAAIALLGGCTIIDIDEELKQQQENAKVIVEYNGKTISKYDVTLSFNKLLSPQGQTIEEKMAEKDTWPGLKESVINRIAVFEIALEQAAALGLDKLTEEEEAEITKDYDAKLASAQSYIEYMTSLALQNDPKLNHDEEYAKQLDAYLTLTGYSADTYREQLKREFIFEKVKAHFLADVTVTEEDVASYYDTNSSLQKQNIELDPSMFGLQQGFGTVLYYPEGYKSVKHILVEFDDETASEAYQAYYYNDTEKYDAAITKGMAALKPTLDGIMARLEAGEDFAVLMEEFNKDANMNAEADSVVVGPHSPNEIPGYAEAAEALLAPGEFSQPFGTPLGAYILRYEKSVAGLVPLADVYDQIYESLKADREDAKWAELTKEWVDAAIAEGKLKMYPNRY